MRIPAHPSPPASPILSFALSIFHVRQVSVVFVFVSSIEFSVEYSVVFVFVSPQINRRVFCVTLQEIYPEVIGQDPRKKNSKISIWGPDVTSLSLLRLRVDSLAGRFKSTAIRVVCVTLQEK